MRRSWSRPAAIALLVVLMVHAYLVAGRHGMALAGLLVVLLFTLARLSGAVPRGEAGKDQDGRAVGGTAVNDKRLGILLVSPLALIAVAWLVWMFLLNWWATLACVGLLAACVSGAFGLMLLEGRGRRP